MFPPLRHLSTFCCGFIEPVGQRYLYGGKEREHAGGRNSYDFSARCLISSIGQWGVPDRKVENMKIYLQNMKLSIGSNLLKICCFIIVLMSGCLLANAQLPVIKTPYGEMSFCDGDESTEILEWLSISSGSHEIDSINSLVIINVAEIADGALGELIGSICLNDFVNKPDVLVSIYKSYGLGKVESYFNHISYWICLEMSEDSNKKLKDMYKKIKRKIATTNIDGLNDIFAYILNKVEGCKQTL